MSALAKTWPAIDVAFPGADTRTPLTQTEYSPPASTTTLPPRSSTPPRTTPRVARVLHCADARDAAATAIAVEAIRICANRPVDVPDEQWAERSQASLRAIRVGPSRGGAAVGRGRRRRARGRLGRGAGRWHGDDARRDRAVDGFRHGPSRVDPPVSARAAADRPRRTNRWSIWERGRACWRLPRRGSAAPAPSPSTTMPMRCDAARANVARNGVADRVEVRCEGLGADPALRGDIVLGNLTGGLLRRLAGAVSACVAPGRRADPERLHQRRARRRRPRLRARVADDALTENGWVALVLR